MVKLLKFLFFLYYFSGASLTGYTEEVLGFLETTRVCPTFKDKKATNLANSLYPDKKYPLIKLDQYSDYVAVKGEKDRIEWVNKDCGLIHYNFENLKKFYFKPFFKAPHEVPNLNDFDKQVLRLCGNWGSEVERGSFADLLKGSIFDELYFFLDKTIITNNAEPVVFKKELLDIWFNEKGFQHIFCGTPQNKKLKGLHYAGRYLEMQEKGWGGKNARCKKTYVNNAVHTIGIDFIDKTGNLAYKCPNSYLYGFNAFDLLLHATKAFKESANLSSSLYKIPTSPPIEVTFIKKNNAILTFFARRYTCTNLDTSLECEYQAAQLSNLFN